MVCKARVQAAARTRVLQEDLDDGRLLHLGLLSRVRRLRPPKVSEVNIFLSTCNFYLIII